MRPSPQNADPATVAPTHMDVSVDWSALQADVQWEPLDALQDLCLAVVVVLGIVLAVHLWLLPVAVA